MSEFEVVCNQIRSWSLDEQVALKTWLDRAIASDLEIPLKAGSEVVEQRQIGKVTYQSELTKCGKPRCWCAGGRAGGHGPYWYAYWWSDGKVRSRYVGKQLAGA